MNLPALQTIIKRRCLLPALFVLTDAWSGFVFAGEPAFSNLFSDHMVLQHGRANKVWGTALPGTKVHVSLAGYEREVRTDQSGKWIVEFPALPIGGPHRLELSGPGDKKYLEDILIGEVWLCSGQSNMEYPMKHLNEPWRDTNDMDLSIRLLTVQHDSSISPLTEFEKTSGWDIATAETVSSFSAACYLFAREMQRDSSMPLGLIDSSWGGSAIEAWISESGLRSLAEYQRALELNSLFERDSGKAVQAFANDWQSWWLALQSEQSGPWAMNFDVSTWPEAPLQLGDWRQWEKMGTAEFTGMAWYRQTFELNSAQASRGAVLELGSVDEVDVTWVNGTPVGTMFGWGTPRIYDIEPGVLQAGTNVLSVNVFNSWAAGGLDGPPEVIRLVLPNKDHVPLGEGWKFRAVAETTTRPPMAPWSSITGVTGLFNAMIAPLADNFHLSGVLWYQGESNTGHAHNYAELLTSMIADWRQHLGASLPFIVVQLPEFGQLPSIPSDSGWARVRDAQQRVAKADALTGLAVTIGSADPSDLHPPNKRIVGARAAMVAVGLLRGNNVVTDGIVPSRVLLNDGEVTIQFSEEAWPLFVSGSATPMGFELCDKRRQCRYASARLDQNQIVLDASTIDTPAEVRHAWADAPLVNLHGAQDIPVSSFRLAVEDGSN